MRAQNRSMQAAPQPGLCACLHLAARLQLLLELSHLHGHQVLLHRLHRRRRKQLLAQTRRAHGGRHRKSQATKAAQKAATAAFLLKKYGAEGSRLAAQAAASVEEGVVCEGEKTREERDAELRDEAVSLDE